MIPKVKHNAYRILTLLICCLSCAQAQQTQPNLQQPIVVQHPTASASEAVGFDTDGEDLFPLLLGANTLEETKTVLYSLQVPFAEKRGWLHLTRDGWEIRISARMNAEERSIRRSASFNNPNKAEGFAQPFLERLGPPVSFRRLLDIKWRSKAEKELTILAEFGDLPSLKESHFRKIGGQLQFNGLWWGMTPTQARNILKKAGFLERENDYLGPSRLTLVMDEGIQTISLAFYPLEGLFLVDSLTSPSDPDAARQRVEELIKQQGPPSDYIESHSYLWGVEPDCSVRRCRSRNVQAVFVTTRHDHSKNQWQLTEAHGSLELYEHENP